MLKKILDKWNSISLVIRISAGILLAVLLYLIFNVAFNLPIVWLGVLGDLFIGALKGIAPILVFVLIISSLAQAKGGYGKRFALVIFLYIATTLLASVIAVIASYIFPVTVSLDITGAEGYTPTHDIFDVFKTLLNNVVANPVRSLTEGNYIGVLFWAVALGVAFKVVASDGTKNLLGELTKAVSAVVRGIISLAPFGVMGLLYSTLSDTGFEVFVGYGKLIAIIVGCMLVTSLVINPLIALVFLRKNPYPLLWRCLKGSALTAFFTRSSAANIPVNMQLCKDLGLEEDFYSVSIPLGATINMDGAAVTIAVMSLAAAHTLGVQVDIGTAILLCIISTFAACGASGIAGGSLLLIPLACSLLGIADGVAMQMVAIGFIIGVIQDSVETALNSSGDVMFTAIAEFYEWRKEGKELNF